METIPAITKPYAYYALAVLSLINLLNYIDRQVLYAIFPAVQTSFDLSDTRLGMLAAAFMVTYLLFAPLFGVLGDRWPRKYFVSLSVGLWSLATVSSGLSRTFGQLLTSRALVGFGEAGYGPIAPTLIADYFPKERRGSMLAYFYMAIPVGSAIGYIAGGVTEKALGWRYAFYLAGLPGILMAVAAHFLREPERGATNSTAAGLPQKQTAPWTVYLSLARTPSYVLNTLAMTAMTFALGGLAAWMPTFLIRVRGLEIDWANTLFGGITVVAGILGTYLGGISGDWLLRYTRKAYFLVSGLGLLLSVPFTCIGIWAGIPGVYFTAIFLAEVFIFLNTGPLNALLANVTLPAIRATAFAVNIFFIHILGDAISPVIIGYLSDFLGLQVAFLVAPFMLALAGFFCLWGTNYVERDMARVSAYERRGQEPTYYGR